jgi:hypothetical protein
MSSARVVLDRREALMRFSQPLRYAALMRGHLVAVVAVTAMAPACAALLAIGDVGYGGGADAGSDAPAEGGQGARFALVHPPVSKTHGLSDGPSDSVVVLPTLAGDLLVVGITLAALGSVISITDNAPGGGNAYESDVRASDPSTESAEIWYARNSRAGATEVTVTLSAAPSFVMWFTELSGLDPTSPLDATNTVSDQMATGSILPAPRVSPSAASAVVLSIVALTGSVTAIESGNPFVSLGTQQGNDEAYYVAHSSGAYGASWTIENPTPPIPFCASTVAFR